MKKETSIHRLLLACGIVAPVFFVGVFSIDGATRPHYSPVHQWVSHLSLGPRGWLGVLNLVFTGVLMMGFALGLRYVRADKKASVWAARCMFLGGVGAVMAGVFPQDPGMGYPPDVPASVGSWHDILHKCAALLLFGSLIAVTLVLRRRFGKGWYVYSLASSIGVTVAFIATDLLAGLDYAKVYPGAPSGLLERIALIIGFTWIFLLAGRLFRLLNPYVPAKATVQKPVAASKLTSRQRIEYINRRIANEHIRPMFSLASVLNTPVERASQALFDLRGDAAANQSAYLMGRPHQTLAIHHDGNYLTFDYGGEHSASFDGWIDRAGNRLVLQGHWWYRGEFVVTAQGSGSRITYNVYNIAPPRSRWMVPLMQRRFLVTMRASLGALTHALSR